jgi:hypothetical protein
VVGTIDELNFDVDDRVPGENTRGDRLLDALRFDPSPGLLA